jgi:hypothetical protein
VADSSRRVRSSKRSSVTAPNTFPHARVSRGVVPQHLRLVTVTVADDEGRV